MHRPLLAVLLGLSITPVVIAAPEVGKPAPDFQVVDTQGNLRTLSEFAGRNVVLEWTNHDCPFVIKHYGSGNMQGLQREFTGQDVAWLTVISSAPGTQGHVAPDKADRLSVERQASPTAVLLDEDGTMGRAFDARVTPHMYVIDAQGILQYAGGIDSIPSANPADVPLATPYFALAARAVLAGEMPDPQVTRPYGCTVKYVD